MKLTNMEGCILGLAIGDALGAPNEFRSGQAIREQPVHSLRAWGNHEAGNWTDDTEMSLALAEALIAVDNPWDLENVMSGVSQHFVDWRNNHDPSRSPGGSCLAGSGNLMKYDWRRSGVESEGCGTIMRVAPVGLFYHQRQTLLASVAGAQAIATHNTSVARDAAIAGAVIVARATTATLMESINEAMSLVDANIGQILRKAVRWYQADAHPEDVLNTWLGWDAGSALGASVFCSLRHQGSYRRAVLEAVNSPGDSDSLGCITGAFLGARLGKEAIPQEWIDQVEERDYLRYTANALFSRCQIPK